MAIENNKVRDRNVIRAEHDQVNITADGDMISCETIVNMLINKKICTAEELFMLEGKIREQNKETKNNNFISVKKEHHRGRFPRIKHAMSRHRWTRRLGTALFGWKWKKVKRSH